MSEAAAGAGRVPFGSGFGGRGTARPAAHSGASSSGARTFNSWNSDDEEKFSAHQQYQRQQYQQHYQQQQRRAAPKPSGYAGYSFVDDSEDDEEPPHTHSRGGAGGARAGAQKTGGVGLAGDHYQTLVSGGCSVGDSTKPSQASPLYRSSLITRHLSSIIH